MMRFFKSLAVYIVDSPLLFLFCMYIALVTTFYYLKVEVSDLVITTAFIIILLAIITKKSLGSVIIVTSLAFFTFFWRTSLFENSYQIDTHRVEEFSKKGSKLTIYINSDPEIDHIDTTYPVVTSFGESFLLRTNRYPIRSIGDECILDFERAKLLQVKGHYKDYLKSKGKVGIVETDDLICRGSRHLPISLKLRRKIWFLKESVYSELIYNFHEPYSSLLAGMIFGDDRLFSEEFEDALRNTGTTHIIAASGFNIAVIIGSVDLFLGRFLNYKVRKMLILILIWLFAICANLSGSIMRACVMASLVILKGFVGRSSNFIEILIITLFLILLINPMRVRDVGLLLSLGATLGLFFVMPQIAEILKKIAGGRKINPLVEENLLSNIACNIGTIPISKAFFGSGSFLAVFPNIFLIPMVEFVYFIGVFFIFTRAVSVSFVSELIKPGLSGLLVAFVFVIEGSHTLFSFISSVESVNYLSWVVSIMIIIVAVFNSARGSRLNSMMNHD